MAVNRREVLEANRYVHSYLAEAGEYNNSPHFRKENKIKVRKILERLWTSANRENYSRLVDFGCGTGFILDLSKDIFDELHGVDITKEMMSQVDSSSGNIFLHETEAENTGFEDEYFDFATAYSFLDHLLDYEAFLKEAHRVLKKGGVLYSDLNPNRDFFDSIESIYQNKLLRLFSSPIVEKEFVGAVSNGALYEESFGLDARQLELAEPIKSLNKGFDRFEFEKVALEVGFSQVSVEYEWYLGQGNVMHERSFEESEIIDAYLKAVLPASSSLYKYLRFILVK